MNLAEALTRSPASLASVLEAPGAPALDAAGDVLVRQAIAQDA